MSCRLFLCSPVVLNKEFVGTAQQQIKNWSFDVFVNVWLQLLSIWQCQILQSLTVFLFGYLIGILPAPDSFNPKKFFQLCGLTKKSPQEVKNVFNILDNDASGFIEEEELK